MLSTMTSPAASAHVPMPQVIDRFSGTSDRLLFASSDLDETRSMVGRVMKPHALRQLSAGERLEARMHHVSLGDVSISRLRYGAAVAIEPGALESFFLVQMPLAGHARIDSGGQDVDSTPGTASVLNPDDDTRMHWSSSTDQLMLRIARARVERTLVGQLGRPLNEPLRFDLSFRWQDCAPWSCLLSYLLDCATQNAEMAHNKLVVAQVEQLVSLILLTSHQHNHSGTSPTRRSTILPRHVRRAQDYLQTHAHEPICIDQLAEVAGVSVRSLFAGFKEFLGVSPMHYLRDLRMEHVRTELMTGEASNVAGIALRWGFAHLGRFSTEYKQRYGESPSQTLRRH